MNALDASLRKTVPGVALEHRREGLRAILAPDCAAVIVRRQPPPSFQSWIGELKPERLPRGRVTLPPERVRDALSQLCSAAETPDGIERDWLVDDAASLAESFADLMKARYLRLRMDVVTTNACRKFHVDAILARLICTYRGTGTEYGVSIDHEDPTRVFTLPTGVPMVMRGTLWPEEPRSGLLHRSPPIEGTGETRLVLVLDPIHDLEADA
ncbi:MAG: DUF1826 domain-containing protein [Pseudomonadota bacterium]